MTRIQIALLGLAVMGVATLAIARSSLAETAEPAYTRVMGEPPFEVRDYAPHVVAEVLVTATRGDPMNAGFGPLADYIFGNNRTNSGPARKIAMTAPVTGQPVSRKIAMTAPVTGQANGADQSRVRFIMPAGETLQTLPQPVNPAVTLVAEPLRRYAVVRFSGLAGASVIARKTQELRAYMTAQGLEPVAEPITAFYDPPWTLPFNRRNDIWIEVAAS